MQELSGSLKLLRLVSSKWRAFGILLLNDTIGSYIDCIEHDCHGIPEDAVKIILDEWFEGHGRDVTWQILIETLRDCDLPLLADQIWESRIKGNF